MPNHYQFGFSHEPVLRLSYIEDVLKHTRAIVPVPSRQTLINLIEDGTLVGEKKSFGYIVTEKSFKAWVRSMQPEAYKLRG